MLHGPLHNYEVYSIKYIYEEATTTKTTIQRLLTKQGKEVDPSLFVLKCFLFQLKINRLLPFFSIRGEERDEDPTKLL